MIDDRIQTDRYSCLMAIKNSTLHQAARGAQLYEIDLLRMKIINAVELGLTPRELRWAFSGMVQTAGSEILDSQTVRLEKMQKTAVALKKVAGDLLHKHPEMTEMADMLRAVAAAPLAAPSTRQILFIRARDAVALAQRTFNHDHAIFPENTP